MSDGVIIICRCRRTGLNSAGRGKHGGLHREMYQDTLSAKRLAAMLSQGCDDLYMQKPGDDTTVAVARVIERKVVNIFTGPRRRIRMMMSGSWRISLQSPGKHIVSGGTTASIVKDI